MAEKYTTEILHHMNEEQLPLNAISPPIFQTSIFQHSSYDALVAAFADEEKSLLYTRGNNPTVNLVEQKIAALEHGEKAKLVASGVAAISQAILAFVQSGDHIIAVEDCYPPTRHLIEIYLKRFGVSSSFVEGTKLEDFENALQSNTRLILLESPTTVTFKLQNLKEVAAFAQQHKIKTIIDNSWATPIFQNPIKFGIDLVVHSASKYLGGNSDIVGGVIIGNKEDLSHIFKNEFLITGPVPDPFQAWLILRNMRTLHIKMPVHFQNTLAITEYLSTHDKVENIIYPFRPDFPQHNLAQEQMRGGVGLFSFRLKTREIGHVRNFINALSFFKIAISWGGYESLIFPLAAKWQDVLQIPNEQISLIRCHVGIEEVGLLIDDLDQALAKIKS